jgi:RimJ/RimL family protein N-acetyltransferase
VLRPWTDDDVEPFVAMSGDVEVMELLGGPLTRPDAESWVERAVAHHERYGWGVWVVEVPGVERFAGCVGPAWVDFEAHFTPAVELRWRLARPVWGHGYATEAAAASLAYALAPEADGGLGLDEVTSFTVPHNRRSRSVMERIGLERDPDGDFEIPVLPEGHPLRPHVLYRSPSDSLARRRTVSGL